MLSHRNSLTIAQKPNPPTTYFCSACELRMIFIFSSGWKKSKEQYFVTCESHMKLEFHCP